MLNLEAFTDKLSQLVANTHQKSFLLAVSGGVDSMVLAHLFLEGGYHFQIVHINYHLREEASDLDQKLVSDFCSRYKIPFHCYEVSEADNRPPNSIQNWARELRYNYFRKIQKKENLELLVTAHHLNDQIETFIINLSKAAGIRGLSGIPQNENEIVRPLLEFSKDELYEYAEEREIFFREDLSNKKNDYLRNKIRHNVVPQLTEINSNFLHNFSKSIAYLNQIKGFLNLSIDEKVRSFSVNDSDNHFVIDKNWFSAEPDIIRYEILKKFGFTNQNEMQKVMSASTGSVFFTQDYQLLVNRDQFIINILEMNDELSDEAILLQISNDGFVELPAEVCNDIKKYGECYWELDSTKVTTPLKIRKRREGDWFYPIGMMGKKKVSKFFKDEKLSALQKKEIWMLCDADDNILGILPLRQDRRFVGGGYFLEVITNNKSSG